MTKFRQLSDNAVRLFKEYFPDYATKEFVSHNLKTWGPFEPDDKKSGELLFEYSAMQSPIIAYSYLANVLSKKHNTRIQPFLIVKNTSMLSRFYLYLLKKSQGVYRSFGAEETLIVCVSDGDRRQAQKLYNEIYPTLENKRDVEQIKIDGVLLGDLIYDDYLKITLNPTIDLAALGFIAHLKDFLSLVAYWTRYFDTHDVKAVHVSHCVYKLAIIARMAVARDIPAYQANATHVYRMNSRRLNAYTDFLDYPEVFKTLPEETRIAGIANAKQRLERRLSGEVGIDLEYSSKSAYTKTRYPQLLEKSDRPKVLIATHCFFDSPHPYGINLFPDFYEWLTFLGDISEVTDYDWYIKTHPDILPDNNPIIQTFLDKYPKFRRLPSDASHHQLIEEGLNAALTVYGTIGLEYAALGVPVINASRVNPHSRCDFNINPESVEEYKALLENLHDIQVDVKMSAIYEYYFMHNIYNTSDWIFDNYEQMIDDLGGYRGQFSSEVYAYFLKDFALQNHQKIINTLENFVESGDFRLSTVHITRSCHQSSGINS